MPVRVPEPRVILLLSTYNGETYLVQQLESLLTQTHENWVLYWRDDGSTDRTVAIMEDFAAGAGQGRCVCIDPSGQRSGPTTSFLTLLAAAAENLAASDAIAFVDQDDVWLPEKLARGLAALKAIPSDEPALYCARQILVDAALHRIGLSVRAPRGGAFPAALTQNIATGCTVILNRSAAALVARSRPSPSTLHDWWCYLLITAAGGRVVQDEEPVVLYRQHATNAVGAPASTLRRGIAALRRGPRQFMTVLRQHVAALAAQPELLSPKARDIVASLNRVLNASADNTPRRHSCSAPGFLSVNGFHPAARQHRRTHMCWHRRLGADGRIERQLDRARQQMQRALPIAINRIAQQRAAEMGAMNPHLMRAPCPRIQLKPCDPLAAPTHPPLCHGGLATFIGHHAPAARTAAAQQLRLNDTGLRIRPAAHHRPIGLAYLPLGERRLCGHERGPAQRHDQATRRIRVQPVRQPRALPPPRETREQILHTRAPTRPGMNRQAGRLVEHNETGILKQDRQSIHRAPRLTGRAGSRKPDR
jgi:hypothetical protein